MINKNTVDHYLEKLNDFVKIISNLDDKTYTRKSVIHIVSDDFSDADISTFCNNFKPIKSIIQFDKNSIFTEVLFEEQDGHLHKALFLENGKLSSIKYECPVCFGTGLNNNEICEFCDNGWGPSDDC